jgi:hypothetical protein
LTKLLSAVAYRDKGLYGAFVVKFNLQVAAFRRKHLGNYAVAEAVTLATITAMVAYFNRFLRLDMTESMAMLFRECEGGGHVNNLCLWAQLRCTRLLLAINKLPMIGRRPNGAFLTLLSWQLPSEQVLL